MLVSINSSRIENTIGFKEYQFRGITVYYSGLIFVSGKKQGEESLRYITEKYMSGEIPFREIYGSYALIIKDDEKIMVFSDNSNMHGIFISEQFIGSNLVEIARNIGGKLYDKAICEYLTFARPIWTDSLVQGVSKLESDKYVVLSRGGIERLNKHIGTIEEASLISNPKEFFKSFVYAIKDCRVITALTGGYDSRLVSCVYNYYSHGDCFISGDNTEGEDIKCSKKTAEAAGFQWKQIIPPNPQLDGDKLIQKLYRTGEYKVEINTSGYRIAYFMSQLGKEYDILLTGDAGDMHKGFWDIRKIPFYPRGFRADMKKFARKYFIVLSNKKYLGENLNHVFTSLEHDTYKKFDEMRRKTVMKSCLYAGWSDWVPAGLRYTEATSPIQYSPLQELELVKYSYGITPKGKHMNMFHRKLISYYNQSASKVKTIYRTTCSDKPIDICLDVFRMTGFYGELIIKYMIRKIFHVKTYVNQYVNRMDLTSKIRESNLAARSVEWARNQGYIKLEYSKDTLPEGILGKIIYLYLLEKDIKIRIVGQDQQIDE